MASAAGLSLPRSPISSRLTLSPRASRDTLAVSASPPPSPASSSRSPLSARAGTNRTGNKPRSSSKDSKENIPLSKKSGDMSNLAYEQPLTRSKAAVNGDALGKEMGNGGGRVWRDGSVEDSATDLRARKAGTGGPSSSKARTSKSPTPSVHSPYNGLPTLPTVFDNDQESEGPGSPESPGLTGTPSRPPPPAASTMTAQGKPVTRKRRSSSIVRKPSPGAVPTKAVDWEIPRKTLHSSIGFLTYFLWYMDPPSLRPLITVLTIGLVSVLSVDVLRLNIPAFAEVWESYLGFLMRESERNQINGVVYYLVGVIFVLAAYPRDVAVVSILTLSWSDTTASTIGRLWGRYTRPLPPHVPGIKLLPFAPRKSLAGFLAATVTGFLICMGSWRNGSEGRWHILEGHWLGLVLTSVVVGVGGAVVEALDLGLDDNLTLPILSGAIMWLWFTVTNVLL